MNPLLPRALDTIVTRELQSSVKSCLALCQQYISEAPQDDDWETAFRSEALADVANRVLPESCHTKFGEATFREFANFLDSRQRLVQNTEDVSPIEEEVVQREMLRAKSLLLTDWSKSLFDGAVAPETNEFINDDCIPPWDTWIELVRVEDACGPCCLVSWVPHWLSEEMELGILADAAECLSWVTVDKMGRLARNGWGERWTA